MEFNQLAPVIMTFVIAGLLLGVGILILDSLTENQGFTEQYAYTENITVNLSSVAVATVVATIAPSIHSTPVLYNSSGASPLVALSSSVYNYTWNRATNTYVFNLTGLSVEYNNSNVTINANRPYYSQASYATNNSVLAIVPIASTWMPILVLILAVAIILGLIVRSFRE